MVKYMMAMQCNNSPFYMVKSNIVRSVIEYKCNGGDLSDMILKQFKNDLTSLREKTGKLVEKEKIIEYYTKNIKLYSLNTNNKLIIDKLSDVVNTIQQIGDKNIILKCM